MRKFNNSHSKAVPLLCIRQFFAVLSLRRMTVKEVNLSVRRLWCFRVFLLISAAFELSVQGRSIALNLPSSWFRPHPDEAAAFARWLVSRSSWGVLNTIASDLGGAPFGNVVSFSDGDPGNSCGIPYFYLTTLDPTASYALKDQRSSFTISEYPLGTCGSKDPENPSCAKITLVGKLKLLDGNSKEADFARYALFTKHPEMKGWPKSHHFQFFSLEIDDIFLINWFGGPKPLTVEQYLQVDMNEVSSSASSHMQVRSDV